MAVAFFDSAAVARLKEIGYTVSINCGTCRFGVFRTNSQRGSCDLHEYTPGGFSCARSLPVHRFGSCDDVDTLGWLVREKLGELAEFFQW